MRRSKKKSFIFRHSLSLAFLFLFLCSLCAQVITGFNEYNQFLTEHDQSEISVTEYLGSGHFIEATFENWESEFLQMGLFVLLTIVLVQEGSSESKKLSGKDEVDREPKAKRDSPWPVKVGGRILKIYNNSLTIALFLLFIISFALHIYGSWTHYLTERTLEHKSIEPFSSYLTGSKFWFESFQNWQSEFLSVFALIFLSIYLRQKGSPQSKPVDASYKETGE